MSLLKRSVLGFIGGFTIGFTGTYSCIYLGVPAWVAVPLTLGGSFALAYYLEKSRNSSSVI
jgi:ABC-type Mn2+/Zn2+ transport system permease subunit